jgi:hypothetical protein
VQEHENAERIPRAVVKPVPPETLSIRMQTGKKRVANEAFNQEMGTWTRSSINEGSDITSKQTPFVKREAEESDLMLDGQGALPPRDIQEHLSEVFFESVYGQAYFLLHKPSFMRNFRSVSV